MKKNTKTNIETEAAKTKIKTNKIKTKILKLKIRVPADYKYLAFQPFGSVTLFKNKPEALSDSEGGGIYYWLTQEDEIDVISDQLIKYNQKKKWKKSVRKIK